MNGVEADYGRLLDTAARALGAGGEAYSLCHVKWDVSGRCEAPVLRDVIAHKHNFGWKFPKGMGRDYVRALGDAGLLKRQYEGLGPQLWIELTVSCRRCIACRAVRAARWRAKAECELQLAHRTWFSTFTLSPYEHFRVLSECRMADDRNGDVFDNRHPDDQFRKRCQVIGRDITTMIKRVRKESRAPLRYLFVAEKHESGLPHYHALIHEMARDVPLRKAVLKKHWRLGYAAFKLVEDPKAATYLCKYLAKDLATRVRSSLNYGKLAI